MGVAAALNFLAAGAALRGMAAGGPLRADRGVAAPAVTYLPSVRVAQARAEAAATSANFEAQMDKLRCM